MPAGCCSARPRRSGRKRRTRPRRSRPTGSTGSPDPATPRPPRTPLVKKGILIMFGALVVLVAIAVIVGARLPLDHVATVRAHYRQPPDSIYHVLVDVAAFPAWRHDVKKVERLPDRNGHV